MMLGVIFSALFLFLLFYAPGYLLARRIPRLDEDERLATGFGLGAALIFLAGFFIYLMPAPEAWFPVKHSQQLSLKPRSEYLLEIKLLSERLLENEPPSELLLEIKPPSELLLEIERRRLVEGATSRTLAWLAVAVFVAGVAALSFRRRHELPSALKAHWPVLALPCAALFLFLSFSALLPFPALGDWYNDWWLNHALSLFYLERAPADTLYLADRYNAVSRPPMFNLCGSFAMLLTGKSYAQFHVAATVLNTAWIMPAFLLAKRFAGHRRALATAILLLFAIFIFKNSVYTWPKLFCTYYVLLALYYYREWLAAAPEARERRNVVLALALGAFAAGYMIHQLALLYAAPVFLHYVWISLRRRIAPPVKAALWVAPAVAALLVPYHCWALHTYGFKGYLNSNPAVFYRQRPEYRGARNFVRVRALNVVSTVVPVVMGEMDTYTLGRKLAWYSRVLAAYYKTILGNAGLTLLIVLAALPFLRRRSPAPRAGPDARDWVSYAAWISAGAFVFLILGHPLERDWGLASVGLQPAMILALVLAFCALLAWRDLPFALAGGMLLEFARFGWGQVHAMSTHLFEIEVSDANGNLNILYHVFSLEDATPGAFWLWVVLAAGIQLALIAVYLKLVWPRREALAAAEADELLPVIDDGGRVTGTERRSVIHRQGLQHLAVHAMIFNHRGELLIQRRAETKDSWPGYWDVSVGGHVGPGESFEEALAREIEEELGLQLECELLRELESAAATGWERVRQFTGRTDETPRPNPAEIDEVAFVDPAELRREIDAGRRRVTPALDDLLRCYFDERDA